MSQPQDIMTTLGPDVVLKGELHFEKGVRLLGSFEGEIRSNGTLVVGEGAHLQGQIHAGAVAIDGTVKGNLFAGGKVVLGASGRLEGDICASRLEVADGAVLIGRCVVGVDTERLHLSDAEVETAPAAAVA